jgi:hypothetical protein
MLGPLDGDVSSLHNWSEQKRLEYDQYGSKALVVAGKELAVRGGFRFVGKYLWNYGVPVFERDWDLLIVLDSCRADVMQEVASEYEFLPDRIPTTYSVGSYTAEWMKKNFTEEYRRDMSETICLTGNPHSEAMLDPEDWKYLGEIWRGHEDSIGAVPPRPITDYGIDADRTHDAPIILHYMQPHQPFRALAEGDESRTLPTKDVWRLLQYGEYSKDEIWDAYKDNLRWVLDDLELLLSNVNREKVVITSDHGNGLGEFGVYGHSQYIPLSPLKEVPWIEVPPVEAKDDYEPKHQLPVEETNLGRDERLEALGYVS